MNTKEQLQEQLDELKRDYKATRSLLEMMSKGTKQEDLAKMRREAFGFWVNAHPFWVAKRASTIAK